MIAREVAYDMIAALLRELSTAAKHRNDPIDSTDNAEPMLRIEPAEPMLPMEATDPMLAMEAYEFFEK